MVRLHAEGHIREIPLAAGVHAIPQRECLLMRKCCECLFQDGWDVCIVLEVRIISAITVVIWVLVGLIGVLALEAVLLAEPFLDGAYRSAVLSLAEGLLRVMSIVLHSNKQDEKHHLALLIRIVGNRRYLGVLVECWRDIEDPLESLAVHTNGIDVARGPESISRVRVQSEMEFGDHAGKSYV